MMKTTRAVTRCYYVNFFPAKRVLTHTPQKATEIFPNAAKLIARIDQGQGLIDRFLLAVPNALCSTSDEVKNAREHLSTEPEDFLNQVFHYMNECQQNQQNAYEFHDEAKQFLKNKKDAFVAEVNEAIQDGSVIPPKSKHMDLVPRVAAALHIFTAAFTNVSAGHDEDPIPTVIDL
jgi:ABC-type transporter Mla subunit MlaD